MTNIIYTPAYISEPPIYDDFFTKDGKITDSWTNWFNSITQSFGFAIVHDVIADNGPPIKREAVAVVTVPSFSEANRDLLQNKRNGTVIYNTTTNRMNFIENGLWITFTPVAA